MPDLTPAHIYDAAKIVDECPDLPGSHIASGALRTWANRLEREQAAEAKREKRAEEIAVEYEHIAYGTPRGIDPSKGSIRIARALMDRYPALVDSPNE